jgi:peptidoglycan/LPS O-acetylase OafA/YrhL
MIDSARLAKNSTVLFHMKQTEVTNTESHWAILAALRFFLAVVVVAGHFSLYVRFDTRHLVGAGYLNPLSAVYGFFILSGYSIAASLDRSMSGFMSRRFVRIWPLYLASIVFGLAVYLLIPDGFNWPLGNASISGNPGSLSIIASLLMLQTVIAGPIATVGPTWSLSAEWWHYMISPVLRKISTPVLLVAMLASFILFVRVNPPGPGVAGMDQLTHGKGILALSWVWMTGFVYYRYRRTPLGILLLIGPSLFALTIEHSTGVPFFITAFVLVAAEEFSVSAKLQRFFNFLGDWSYPLYLFHMACFIAVLHLGSNRSIITLSSAFIVSLLALYLVDYPSRTLFKRKAKRKATARPVAL